MENAERRWILRYVIRVPFKFRLLRSGDRCEHFGTMLDVSPRGMRFKTITPLVVGSSIEVFMKLPDCVLGTASAEWRWIGTAVHVVSCEVPDHHIIVGLRFLAGQSVEDSEVYADKRLAEAQGGPLLQRMSQAEAPKAPAKKLSRYDMSGRKL